MTSEPKTPRRPNVGDIYRGQSGATRSARKKSPSHRPLQPLDETGDGTSEKEPAAPKKQQRPTARRTRRNPQAGKPTLSVRLPATLLTRFDEASERAQLTPLELALTAVADALPDLPALVAQDNAAKGMSTEAGGQTYTIGGLFEVPGRQSNSQRGRGSVQRMWRTTSHNVDGIDRIVQEVGASDRQQLLLLALTRYLETTEA